MDTVARASERGREGTERGREGAEREKG